MAGQPLPRSTDEYDGRQMRRLLLDLDQRLSRLETAINTGWLDPTNLTVKRDLDANGTLAEIGDVLGTLIQDMKAKGQLSG